MAQFVSVEPVQTEVSDGIFEFLPTVRITGANLQIVNGLGTTSSLNALGNLIVGYNESRFVNPFPTVPEEIPVCSDGQIIDEFTCLFFSNVWSANHKSGSHNIIVGPKQSYSQAAGLVAGIGNTVNGVAASVTGGSQNTASGSASSVSGGTGNEARGAGSSVTGGNRNFARGRDSSISGGSRNTAHGIFSSVSGGVHNFAVGDASSVSGGEENGARGRASSVSGGTFRNTTNDFNWAAGTLFELN